MDGGTGFAGTAVWKLKQWIPSLKSTWVHWKLYLLITILRNTVNSYIKHCDILKIGLFMCVCLACMSIWIPHACGIIRDQKDGQMFWNQSYSWMTWTLVLWRVASDSQPHSDVLLFFKGIFYGVTAFECVVSLVQFVLVPGLSVRLSSRCVSLRETNSAAQSP